MKNITWRKLLLCGFVLSILLSVIICGRTGRHEIQSAASLSSQNGFLYGMDVSDDAYYLFRTDEASGYSRMIRVPRVSGGAAVRIRDMVVDKNENVYFHYLKKGEQREEWIGICDFSQGRIKKFWDYQDITDEGYWVMINSGQDILMETMDDNGRISEWVLDQENLQWKSAGRYPGESLDSDYEFGGRRIWRCDKWGNIFVQTIEMDKEECALLNDGTRIGRSNCFRFTENDKLHFLNLESGKNYVLEYRDGNANLQECRDCVDYAVLEEQFGYIGDLKSIGSGRAIGFTWIDQRKVPFLYGESSLILSELRTSPGDQAVRICVNTLVILAIFCAISLVVVLIRKWRGGVFPLLAQILFLGIPLFVIICMRSYGILDRIFEESLVETEKETLVQAAVFYRDSIEFSDMVSFMDYQDDVDLKIALSGGGHYDMEYGSEKKMGNQYYTCHYIYQDGEIYDLTEGHGPTVALSYVVDKSFYEAARKTVSMNTPVVLVHQDINGNWMSVLVPYYDENGDTMAVIEVREDMEQILNRISASVGMLTREIFLGFGLLAAAISVIVYISLFPLGSLSRAVMEISEGKMDVQMKVRLRFTEIGRISQVFNQMSVNISRSMHELSEIGRKYSMFVPAKFLNYLGKESILQTTRGDYAEEDFVVMEISSLDFEAVSGSLTGKQHFEIINQALERIVPVLETHNGMVADFDNAGALSIYKEDGRLALTAAVDVIQNMNRECLKAGEIPLHYTVGICFGSVRLGMIGAGSRSEAAAMSLSCQLAEMLQRMAVKYGASILISGDAVKHVADFEQSYHYRTLGYAWIGSKNVVDVIYDVYDGDDADVRQLKQKTKEMFEEGVRLYMAKEFREARNCFVKVLYENRDDLAARQYFLRCEKFLNGEADDEQDHYIEIL